MRTDVVKHQAGQHDQKKHGMPVGPKILFDSCFRGLDIRDINEFTEKWESIANTSFEEFRESYPSDKLTVDKTQSPESLGMTLGIGRKGNNYANGSNYSHGEVHIFLAAQGSTGQGTVVVPGYLNRHTINPNTNDGKDAYEELFTETDKIAKASHSNQIATDSTRLPILLAEERGYKFTLARHDAIKLVANAAEFLDVHYDIQSSNRDKEIALTTVVDKVIRSRPASLSLLLDIKHPKHPDVPFFVEYLSWSTKDDSVPLLGLYKEL